MKILMIHASAGAGHMKAAEALTNGFKKYTSHQAVMVDALDYTSPHFKKLYRDSYTIMIKHFPTVWAMAFAIIDIPLLQPLVRFGRRIYNHMNGKKLEEFLIAENFDYIFACHFMSVEVAASLKRQGKIKSKLVTVITDYDVHRIWIADGVDHYTVACEWTEQSLINKGVDKKIITVSGIPTDEKFGRQPDIGALKEKLGLEKNRFTVLIACGSFGFGPIEEIVKTLSDFQVVVVTGHNKTLLESLTTKQYSHVKALGLINNMHEMMAASDVMITKPGGLSITEAMVTGLPMIFFSPIPGQETSNIKILATYGIGISDCPVDRMAAKLLELRDSKDAYLTMVRRTRELARPHAVKDIINLAK